MADSNNNSLGRDQEADNSIFEEIYDGDSELSEEELEQAAAAEAEASARQENKSALPRFILIVIASLAVGVAVGTGLVFLDGANLGQMLQGLGAMFTNRVAGWGLILLPVIELAVCVPMYSGARKKIEKWDSEDEEAGAKIEARLSRCMWLTSMVLIVGFFLAAALFTGFASSAGSWRVSRGLFFGGLAAFVVMMLITVLLQQNLVDATKEMNPEKKGSVYDVNFQKKWVESCDEAERAMIGQCSYQAYRAVSTTCLVLWVVFTLGAMMFDWGFLPVLAVCVIWGVGQSVYFYNCLKADRPKKKQEPQEEEQSGEEA